MTAGLTFHGVFVPYDMQCVAIAREAFAAIEEGIPAAERLTDPSGPQPNLVLRLPWSQRVKLMLTVKP